MTQQVGVDLGFMYKNENFPSGEWYVDVTPQLGLLPILKLLPCNYCFSPLNTVLTNEDNQLCGEWGMGHPGHSRKFLSAWLPPNSNSPHHRHTTDTSGAARQC